MEDSKTLLITFHGSLAIPGNGNSEFSTTIRFPKLDPTILMVDLLWLGNEDERKSGDFALSHLGRNHVLLNSLDPFQGPAELLGISQVSTKNGPSLAHSSSIRVEAVQIGINKDKGEKVRKYKVFVRLQPSGILSLPSIHTLHFTGEIQVKRFELGVVELKLDNSMFEARETFEYYETQENGNKITHRVQRVSLIGEVTVDPGESLFEVHESLKRQLNEVCTALSLCYRQPVDYYQVDYIGDKDNNPPWHPIYRRRWSSIKVKASSDELINTQALLSGGLQKLVSRIREFSHASDIRRAIEFIAASYTVTTESAFFMAFSAMETILSCCLERSEEFVLGSSEWKKVESSIRQAIRDQIPANDEVRAKLCDKLPELRRSTLSWRINKVCQMYDPKIDDLWPNISFEEGMKRAARIRNGLFHAADSSVEDSIRKDLLRVRIFTERLILKVLDWPDEAIGNWYDQDLRWTNQGDL